MFLNQKSFVNLYGVTCTNCGKLLTDDEELYNFNLCNSCRHIINIPLSYFNKNK